MHMNVCFTVDIWVSSTKDSGKGDGVRTRGRDNQYGSQVTIVMSAANKSSVVFILLGLSR